MTLFTVPHAEYSFALPRRQLFPFPSDVISFMLENPSSSKGLMKLYQTCKCFYGKRPILIAERVSFVMDQDEEDYPIPDSELRIYVGKQNVAHLKTPIWAVGRVFFTGYAGKLPNFYRYSVKSISLQESELDFKDFVMLSSEKTITQFTVDNSSCVYQSDVVWANSEDLLPHLPNIQLYSYNIVGNCSREALERLNQIEINRECKSWSFQIYDIHPTFDMNLFSDFIMKLSNADSAIYLYPSLFVNKKLRHALKKLYSKWKTEACDALKKMFREINPKWEQVIGQ